jgi:DNA modification methylase
VTPYLYHGDVVLYHGDVIDTLRALPAGVAQTCVTSPPYWGLRDYQTGTWAGGDEACDHIHQQGGRNPETAGKQLTNTGTIETQYRDVCAKCGARRVDSQLGLEPTPEAYVERMVAVFREVWRVLRPDGTVWLNLGDSYAGSGPSGASYQSETTKRRAAGNGQDGAFRVSPTLADRGLTYRDKKPHEIPNGLKPKDLVGIPWRVAFALQSDGWVLRSAITWSKPNPMPESVTDRPTKSSEDLFLFAKGKWSGPEPGRFGHISDADARWLALLFDTEGNIVIKRAEREGRLQFGAQMAFANCSRALLERRQVRRAESYDAVWLLMDAHALLDHPVPGPPVAQAEHASSWPSTVYKRGSQP